MKDIFQGMIMNKIFLYYHKLRTTPFDLLARYVCRRTKERIFHAAQLIHDGLFDTRKEYPEMKSGCIPLPLGYSELDLSAFDKEKAKEYWRMIKKHRFDLLGSGWVRNRFKDEAKGLDGFCYKSIEVETDKAGKFLSLIMKKRNISTSVKIWQMIDGDYEAIDWQKDCKSGYRWGASKWYRPQGNAKKLGGDIKMPWELSRLQHLPRLALIAKIFPLLSFEARREFRNQTIDFIAQNPPRMGVNYMCTMDVGIRTANLALAWSLFQDDSGKFDAEFEMIFANHIFSACDFIYHNLEWSEVFTSNHYFADITGLLYGSAILPDCAKKRNWLRFAANEIVNEIKKQFNLEGTNREGSTAYHRLTGEMAVYSLALMKALSKQGFCDKPDENLFAIMEKAGIFTYSIMRPDTNFPQIGDNDSGLFFRLSFTGDILNLQAAMEKYANLSTYVPEKDDAYYLDENLNDARPFVAAVAGIGRNDMLEKAATSYPLEKSLVAGLMGKDDKMDFLRYELDNNITFYVEDEYCEKICLLPYTDKWEMILPRGAIEKLNMCAYPEFGLYLYTSKRLYLCINATTNGQKGNAGHAHNDKLSFELFVDGTCIFEDSGTYVYTALPEIRNNFRSVKMHNTIDIGREQNEFLSLFSMKDETRCRCLSFTSDEAIFEAAYGDALHRRTFRFSEEKLIVEDECNVPFTENWKHGQTTRGYGKLLR